MVALLKGRPRDKHCSYPCGIHPRQCLIISHTQFHPRELLPRTWFTSYKRCVSTPGDDGGKRGIRLPLTGTKWRFNAHFASLPVIFCVKMNISWLNFQLFHPRKFLPRTWFTSYKRCVSTPGDDGGKRTVPSQVSLDYQLLAMVVGMTILCFRMKIIDPFEGPYYYDM